MGIENCVFLGVIAFSIFISYHVTMFRTWRKEDKMREMEVAVEEKDAAPSRKVDFDR